MKKAKINPESGPLRVLILEDSPADAELMQRELKKAGIAFTPRLVDNKKEFSDALAEFSPQVILSDFKLPRFNGLAALEIARSRAADVPLLFVSGSIGEEKAIETLAQGAADYIFKENMARLGPAVKRVIADSRLRQEKKKTDEELQRHIEELRILSEASDRFVRINDLEKLHDYLSRVIGEISGADYQVLSLYDEKLQAVRPKVIIGFEPFAAALQRFGIDLRQTDFYLKDMRPPDFADFVSRRLLPVRDGLHGFFNRKLPRAASRAGEKLLAIESLYTMGISWENQLFGGITVFFKKGHGLKNASQVEALVNLAAVAIKRLLAERALLASEEKYRTLVTQSPDGIFIIDLQGNFLSINQSLCAGLGFSEAELLAMNFRDIVPESYLDLHRKRLAEIVKGNPQDEAAEYEVRTRDGRNLTIAILSAPYFKNNRLIGIQGIARDITERKKMETRLRESEEYYRTLVQTSPDAIIIVNAGGRVEFASQKTLEVFGIPGQTPLLGASILDFVEPGETHKVQERMVEILSGRSLPEFREYRLRRRDGTTFWADVSSAPLCDAAGRSIGLLLICRDVSARKRFEAVLSESEAKYRLIADNTAETITVLDLELNLTYVSPSILRLRGYTAEEVLRQTLPQILTPDSLAKIQQILAEETALEQGGAADPKRSRTLELQEYHRDGSVIWVENTISFLRDEAGKPIGFLAVARDVSERKRAENALRQSEEKFRRIFEDHAAVKLLIDPESGAILDANQAAVEFYGWTRDELKKMSVDRINDLPAADVANAIRTVRERKRVQFEFRHRRADGSVRDVEVFSSNIAIDGRDIIHSIIHDITERKLAEKQIAYQANLLQEVSDAIIATDAGNRIQMWNKAAERIYGWKAAETIGKVFRDVIRPEYHFQRREEVMDKLGREGVWSGELTHNLRDGRQILVQSTITVLKDAAGRPAGIVSVSHDISERMQAEEKLHERDRLLQNLSAQVPGMIYTFQRRPDGTYCIPYSSNAILDIFGVSPRDVAQDASAIFRAILADDQPRVVASIENSARALTPWKAEYRVQLPGRPVRWMFGQSDPVRLNDGSVLWYGFNTDITERKQAENLIRSSLKEKEVLLQEIHHRVKNNLQVISGLLTLQADQAAGKSVDEIFSESQDRIRSIALIHEKLYRSHNLAEIPFDEYLRDLVANLFTSHGVDAGRIAAAFDVEAILFTIEKAIPLGLIVNELVTNALKHAFPGGRRGEIRIGLHGRLEGKSLVRDSDSGPLYRVRSCELIVADDGVGLPPGHLPEQEKTLGMKLVSMLARQLQTELKVKSGDGTEFRLILSGLPAGVNADDTVKKGGSQPWPKPGS